MLLRLAGGIFLAKSQPRIGEKDRVIVVEGVEGKTVTITAGAPGEECEEFLPKAQGVLDTVEWEGV